MLDIYEKHAPTATNLCKGLVGHRYPVADHIPNGLFAMKRQKLATVGLGVPLLPIENARTKSTRVSASATASAAVKTRNELTKAARSMWPKVTLGENQVAVSSLTLKLHASGELSQLDLEQGMF